MATPLWSLLTHTRHLDLQATLKGGQAFRWTLNTQNNNWYGVIGANVVVLRTEEEKIFYRLHPQTGNPAAEQAMIQNYFNMQYSLPDMIAIWDQADPAFASKSVRFSGLRLLRQDPVETLFSFICSQNNNIARISKMIHALCEHHGPFLAEVDGMRFHGFPSVEKLAQLQEDDLKQLGFGYRARYIITTAQQIEAKGESWLRSLATKDRIEVQKELCQLMGMPFPACSSTPRRLWGQVADCVALFSLDKLDVIPVDTHIACNYIPHLKKRLNDEVYEEIGDYFRKKFGQNAGWAHSILFANELSTFKKDGSCKIEQPSELNASNSKPGKESNKRQNKSSGGPLSKRNKKS